MTDDLKDRVRELHEQGELILEEYRKLKRFKTQIMDCEYSDEYLSYIQDDIEAAIVSRMEDLPQDENGMFVGGAFRVRVEWLSDEQ